MFLITILKSIFDIKKILIDLVDFCKSLRRWGFFKPPIILIISTLLLMIYILASTLFIGNNHLFLEDEHRAEKVDRIDSILRSCGDKTAISVSVVSMDKVVKLDDSIVWGARFQFARARDMSHQFDSVHNILDLKAFKPEIYNRQYELDLITYTKLLNIGDGDILYFSLTNEDEVQTLESVANYSSIVKLLKLTDWYKEGTLRGLSISSTLIRDITGERLLYVTTFISAGKIQITPECFNNIYLNLNKIVK